MTAGGGPPLRSWQSGALAACAALAAALEEVRHGATPGDVERAAVQAARQAGATEARLEVLVSSPGRLTASAFGVPETLHKTELVVLCVSGVAAVPFAAARTTVVGFDTLPADAAAADTALRGLVAGTSAAVPGATAEDVDLAVRQATGLPCEVAVDLLTRDGAESGSFAAERIVYVEVTVLPGPDHQGVRLGDMVRVDNRGGTALTTLATRLWL